jgi:hypothetical protein
MKGRYLVVCIVLMSSFCQFSYGQDFGCWQYQPSAQCHGDTDGDGDVDTDDLLNWGPARDLPVYPGSLGYAPFSDFERDFDVDLSDGEIFEIYFGSPPQDCAQKLELEPVMEYWLPPGSTYTIQWNWNYFYEGISIISPNDHPGDIRLYYSTNSGQSWTTITTITDHETREYEWLVPDVNSNACMLRIVDLAHFGLTDESEDTFSTYPCQGPIIGDIDGDCYVNLDDLGLMGAYWLANDCNEMNQWCSGTDLDENEIVDLNDFAIVGQNWCDCGDPCDPSCQE